MHHAQQQLRRQRQDGLCKRVTNLNAPGHVVQAAGRMVGQGLARQVHTIWSKSPGSVSV